MSNLITPNHHQIELNPSSLMILALMDGGMVGNGQNLQWSVGVYKKNLIKKAK